MFICCVEEVGFHYQSTCIYSGKSGPLTELMTPGPVRHFARAIAQEFLVAARKEKKTSTRD